MPVKSSPYYNDPALGQAFSNLSGLFAPPDAKELYAAAEANATTQKAARLQDLYNYASGANPDRGVLDTRAAAAGIYPPNQSFYSVDKDNATKRYGFDQGLAGTRYTADQDLLGKKYGSDVVAQTSLQTDAADNAEKLRQAALDQKANLVKDQYGALNADQVRPGMPAEVAGQFGLPAVAPQTGVIKLGQGDTATLPNGGGTLTGMPKPLTMDEWTAQQAQSLRQNKQLSDMDLVDIIHGKSGQGAPVLGKAPDGSPLWLSPMVAARTNAPAYVKSEAGARPDVMNYTLPDGTRGTAVPQADGTLVDSQTGIKLPQGLTTSKGVMQGAPDQFGRQNEAQQTAGYAATSTGQAIGDLIDAYRHPEKMPTTSDFYVQGAQKSFLGPMARGATQSLTTSNGQQFYYNLHAVMPIELLIQSGAAHSQQEADDILAKYEPVPGDVPEVREDKLRSLLAYRQSLIEKAGPAWAKAHGLDGQPIDLGAPGAAGGQAPGRPAQAAPADPLSQARGAIQRGAPRDKVIERLRAAGIDPTGL